VTGVFADWSRVSIAERAEDRAAVNDQRKLISDLTKAASRVHDLLGNEDEVKRLRAVVDAEKGVTEQVNAIMRALWGDLFSGAEEEAA
jgi:ATP phosphoribosyltransferase regulatory subunit HisZ